MDTRAQQGIQLASAKVNMADQHAQDAATKAEAANQTAAAVNTHASPRSRPQWEISDKYKSSTQTEIRFRHGQTALSKTAKDALDELATQLKDQHGYIIEVQGFSSGQGQVAIANSKRIADSVVRYLVLNHENTTYRIYTVQWGSAPVNRIPPRTGLRSTCSRMELSRLPSNKVAVSATDGPVHGK